MFNKPETELQRYAGISYESTCKTHRRQIFLLNLKIILIKLLNKPYFRLALYDFLITSPGPQSFCTELSLICKTTIVQEKIFLHEMLCTKTRFETEVELEIPKWP